jgi:hypothetical protein
LRHLPQQKKDNLLRQQKKTPTTPFSANSRKKITQSSNLTIISKHQNQKRQPPATAGKDNHDTFFGEWPKKDHSLIQPHDYLKAPQSISSESAHLRIKA